MAGNYMDAPASRVAYDRDGSIGTIATAAGLMTQLSAAQLRALNGETETGITLNNQRDLAIVFPAALDIVAVFFAVSLSSPTWTLETSKDTTTGLDGTWETHVSGANRLSDVKPNYRIYDNLMLTVPGAPSTGVKGIRLRGSAASSAVIRGLHIYADISTTSAADRLAFWHPTVDEPLEPDWFDWGNVPRGSSADKSFRLKNLSADMTAEDITLFIEALTPGSPSVAGMHTLSGNGGSTFLTSITIDEILPDDISDVLVVRRVVPTNAQVSVWSARVAADVSAWTS